MWPTRLLRPLGVDLDQHAVAAGGVGDDVVDVALDRLGRDAVFDVVGVLLFAAAVGLGDRAFHAAGHAVGIEDHPAVDVARGAADGLDQRGLAAQEAFLVGVEDADQPAFGNVEPFAQQVDADQHVVDAQPQVADQLDALQRLDVANACSARAGPPRA